MKILGVIVLLFSGVGLAVRLSRDEDRALRQARALLEFLSFVNDAVENYALPASQILLSCDPEIIFAMGYREGAGMPTSFEELALGCDFCDAETSSVLSEFAGDFGNGYRAQQVAKNGHFIDKAKRRLEKLERRVPGRKKMILSVVLCITLIVIILLL